MRARSLQDAFCELQDLAFVCCRCDDARAPRGRLRLPWPTGWALQDLARFRGLSRFSSVRFLCVSCVRGHPAGSPVRCRWRAPFPCSFVVVLIAPRESCSPTYCNASKQKQQQQITPLIPHPWILSHGIPPPTRLVRALFLKTHINITSSSPSSSSLFVHRRRIDS